MAGCRRRATSLRMEELSIGRGNDERALRVGKRRVEQADRIVERERQVEGTEDERRLGCLE
jgi:hypothetical protein